MIYAIGLPFGQTDGVLAMAGRNCANILVPPYSAEIPPMAIESESVAEATERVSGKPITLGGLWIALVVMALGTVQLAWMLLLGWAAFQIVSLATN
jgi:hypothetical protein